MPVVGLSQLRSLEFRESKPFMLADKQTCLFSAGDSSLDIKQICPWL